jgi:hypothetical protein
VVQIPFVVEVGLAALDVKALKPDSAALAVREIGDSVL